MRSGGVSVLVLCATACGPDVASDGGKSDTGSSTTRADTSSSGGSGGAQTSAEDPTPADTSTAGAPACESATPDCPAGCSLVPTLRGTWDAPELVAAEPLCVALGEPIADGYRSTWWTEQGGELRFITSYQDCGALAPPGTPTEWTECTHSPDAPAPCRARCAADSCPGDVEVELLRGCDVEVPCGPITLYECHQGNVDCLLEGLRDRTAGRYELSFQYPNSQYDWVLVVDDDGSVRASSLDAYNLVCSTGIWTPARTCVLAEPQVFDDCLQLAAGCADGCFADQAMLAAWLLDCTDEPPTCP